MRCIIRFVSVLLLTALLFTLPAARGADNPIDPQILAEAQHRLELRQAAAKAKAAMAAAAATQPARIKTDLVQLCEQMSGPYILMGTEIPSQQRDAEKLQVLQHSSEPRVGKLAEQRLECDQHWAEAKAAADLTREAIAFQFEFEMLLLRSVSDADASDDAIPELTRSRGALQRAQKKRIYAAQLATQAMKAEQDLRNSVTEELHAKSQGTNFAATQFSVGFHVIRTEGGLSRTVVLVTLENDSSLTLHNCVVVTRAKMSTEKIHTIEAKQMPADLVATAFSVALGANPEFAGNAFAQQMVGWETEGIEKGNVVTVPEWKPGTRLEVAVSPARALLWMESAEVSLWSDDGYLEARPLAVQKMIQGVNNAVKAEVARRLAEQRAAEAKAKADRERANREWAERNAAQRPETHQTISSAPRRVN